MNKVKLNRRKTTQIIPSVFISFHPSWLRHLLNFLRNTFCAAWCKFLSKKVVTMTASSCPRIKSTPPCSKLLKIFLHHLNPRLNAQGLVWLKNATQARNYFRVFDWYLLTKQPTEIFSFKSHMYQLRCLIVQLNFRTTR